MPDLTTLRNLKNRTATAVGVSRIVKLCLRQLMPAHGCHAPISRLRGITGIVLAILFAAGTVWTVMDLISSRSGASEPAKSKENKQAQIAQIDAMVKEILDRPVFSRDRSPPPPPPSPAELAALQRPVLKSHLAGIAILAGLRVALFVSDGDKYVSVKEGGDIDGFKVRSIAADRVILASAFGEQIVQPSKGTYETVRNTKLVELGDFDPDKH